MTGTKGRDGRRTSLRRKFKDPNAELRKDFYREKEAEKRGEDGYVIDGYG